MRASTPTKLSLYEWSTMIGMNPLHLAGIDLASIRGAHCTKPLPQYDWQEGDRVSREQIARAIAMAEENMENYLGFHVLPSYDVNESMIATGAYPLPQADFIKSAMYRAKWGYFIEGGRRAVTQLTIIPQAQTPPLPNPADIVWSLEDAPPPGIYWRVGTVLATVPADTDPCEVRVFYPDHDADPAWEIRPADVTISGTTATIVFRRELVVNPDQWDALEYLAANGDDNADFLDTVDVYRVYTDPSQQIALYGHPHLCPYCSDTVDPSAGEAGVIDPTLSQLHIAKGTWTNGVFTPNSACSPISTRALFSYYSGYADGRQACPTKTMDGQLARAVAVYAAALLERPPCDCTVDSWLYWREDANEGKRYAIQSQRATPFGTRRGAVYAWERVLELTLGQGVVLA